MAEKLDIEWEIDQDVVIITLKARIPITEFLGKADLIARLHQPVRRINPDRPAIQSPTEED